MNIQWYPGHMTKTKRNMAKEIKLCDIVIELLDARVPTSSRNPDIDNIAQNKKRIIVLNKSDMADDNITREWKRYYEKKGFSVVIANSIKGNGINDITTVSRALMKEKIDRLMAKGRIFVPIRAMIVGIPNVGKSTLINKYVGKNMAKTGDRPGVTRSSQWIRIKKDFELLDTPGILWPKFEDQQVGINLAMTGAINDQILDRGELACCAIRSMCPTYSQNIKDRYKIEFTEDEAQETPHIILEKIALARKFIKKGNEVDYDRTSIIFLDELRACKLGNISFERPPVEESKVEAKAEVKEVKTVNVDKE